MAVTRKRNRELESLGIGPSIQMESDLSELKSTLTLLESRHAELDSKLAHLQTRLAQEAPQVTQEVPVRPDSVFKADLTAVQSECRQWASETKEALRHKADKQLFVNTNALIRDGLSHTQSQIDNLAAALNTVANQSAGDTERFVTLRDFVVQRVISVEGDISRVSEEVKKMSEYYKTTVANIVLEHEKLLRRVELISRSPRAEDPREMKRANSIDSNLYIDQGNQTSQQIE